MTEIRRIDKFFQRILTEPFTELVFQRRNKEYGSYQLRRKYLKTLCISVGFSTLVFFFLFLIPFLIFMAQGINAGLETEYIYEVEYIPFAPPEDLELVELAKAHAKAPNEQQVPPAITDTVIPEKEKPPKPVLPDKEKDQPEEADTSSYGTNGDEQGRQAGTDTAVSTTIDVYPRYPGGDEARLYYLRTHVIYPQEAIQKGIQGTVMVVFVVEADGSVSSVKIGKGIGGGCDEEAVRVTWEMQRWSPGKRSGRPVRVMVRMPIIYRLPKK
ncbi:MAG: TonB family protein [bacterium]